MVSKIMNAHGNNINERHNCCYHFLLRHVFLRGNSNKTQENNAKYSKLLRSECVMADVLWLEGWVRFRTLYRWRYLRDLIMYNVGHSSRNA